MHRKCSHDLVSCFATFQINSHFCLWGGKYESMSIGGTSSEYAWLVDSIEVSPSLTSVFTMCPDLQGRLGVTRTIV